MRRMVGGVLLAALLMLVFISAVILWAAWTVNIPEGTNIRLG